MSKITENFQVVTPAYGCDYRKADDAKADFLAGKDFVLHSIQHGEGYCSIRDFASGVTVNIRYAKQSKVVPCVVPTIADTDKCPLCGEQKPVGQSCICFDNNCE